MKKYVKICTLLFLSIIVIISCDNILLDENDHECIDSSYKIVSDGDGGFIIFDKNGDLAYEPELNAFIAEIWDTLPEESTHYIDWHDHPISNVRSCSSHRYAVLSRTRIGDHDVGVYNPDTNKYDFYECRIYVTKYECLNCGAQKKISSHTVCD